MKLIVPKFWRSRTFLSQILKPLATLYNIISSYIAYVPLNKVYQPKAKIINVGNITMGGAGKTPVVMSIAQIIQNHSKHKVAILSRGYKGSLFGPIIIDNENHNINEAGDEALMLSKQAPTCVAKNRLQGIKFLENLGYEVIITDDGLQDQRFRKNITIIVIDSYFGFGNEMLFPAGPLRETIESGIKKADLIVIIGQGKIKYKWPKSLPILKADLVSRTLLQQQKFIAFAGIGNPDKFFLSVEEAEGKIVKTLCFADHHQYTDKELETLIELAEKHEAQLITTEKDYTRIDDKYKSQIQVLPVSMVWKNEQELLMKLL